MRTVQIIGKALNAAAAPLDQSERWLCNDAFTRFDGPVVWDRWFDIHSVGHIQKHRPHAWDFYAGQDGDKPIYLHAAHPEIPGSRAFPRTLVESAFPGEEFFTSSLDWMLALAIALQVDRIALYGIDMDDGHERERQRDGAHYWIGIARGRGIAVEIPDASSLCKTERLYGYFEETSDRNFASMSLARFLRQCRAADARTSPAFQEPGID